MMKNILKKVFVSVLVGMLFFPIPVQGMEMEEGEAHSFQKSMAPSPKGGFFKNFFNFFSSTLRKTPELPLELWLKISSYLNQKEKFSLITTCKRFNKKSSDIFKGQTLKILSTKMKEPTSFKAAFNAPYTSQITGLTFYSPLQKQSLGFEFFNLFQPVSLPQATSSNALINILVFKNGAKNLLKGRPSIVAVNFFNTPFEPFDSFMRDDFTVCSDFTQLIKSGFFSTFTSLSFINSSLSLDAMSLLISTQATPGLKTLIFHQDIKEDTFPFLDLLNISDEVDAWQTCHLEVLQITGWTLADSTIRRLSSLKNDKKKPTLKNMALTLEGQYSEEIKTQLTDGFPNLTWVKAGEVERKPSVGALLGPRGMF